MLRMSGGEEGTLGEGGDGTAWRRTSGKDSSLRQGRRRFDAITREEEFLLWYSVELLLRGELRC